MGSFIRHKKEKVKKVFQFLGSDHNEEDFINTFKRLYPEDWQKISCVYPGHVDVMTPKVAVG